MDVRVAQYQTPAAGTRPANVTGRNILVGNAPQPAANNSATTRNPIATVSSSRTAVNAQATAPFSQSSASSPEQRAQSEAQNLRDLGRGQRIDILV